MIVKLAVILLAAFLVFWLIRRALPALRSVDFRRLLPVLMSPLAFGIIRRVLAILLRLILRR
jgi:hypothetical protein